MKITKETLENFKACKKQVDLFEIVFPDGAKVNQENIDIALSRGLNIYWLAICILKGPNLKYFQDAAQSARLNYRNGNCSWADYLKICAYTFLKITETIDKLAKSN